MSFGGHVLDMIRRSKDNRDLLKLRREKSNNTRNKLLAKSNMSYNSDITAEEWDEINKQIKQREKEQNKKINRLKLIYLTFIVIGVILLGVLTRFVLF